MDVSWLKLHLLELSVNKKQVIKTRGGVYTWPGRGGEGRPYMNLGMLQWWLDWLGLFRFSAIINDPNSVARRRIEVQDARVTKNPYSFEFGARYIEKSNKIFWLWNHLQNICIYKIISIYIEILYVSISTYDAYLHMIHIYIWYISVYYDI